MRLFQELIGLSHDTRVLDMGGGAFVWSLLDVRPKVTILDIRASSNPEPTMDYIVADGCNTGLPSRSFDVVFSNSVIEHVGDISRQRDFARECMRCGKCFFVQTPYKWFPIDPHTFMLFGHWFPKKVFTKLMKWSPRFLISRPTHEDIEDFVNMRLLGKKEMQELFPQALIIEEKFFGLTKSLIAVGSADRWLN